MSINYADFYFQIQRFDFKSKEGYVFIGICIVLSGFGLGLLLALPVIWFFFNYLLKGFFYRIITVLLKQSNSSIGRIISYFPRIDFRGKWFMQQNPKHRDYSSLKRIRKYTLRNLTELILIQSSTFILSLRILLSNSEITLSRIFPFGLSLFQYAILLSGSFFLSFSYFIIIWSMRDAELKLIEEQVSTVGKKREMVNVTSLSNSFQSLFGFILGIPAIIWLVDFIQSNDIAILTTNVIINSIIIITAVTFVSLGGILFASIYMVNSDQYLGLVNSIRLWMLESTRDVPGFQKHILPPDVSESQITEVVTNQSYDICQNCNYNVTTRFCTNCGFDRTMGVCPYCHHQLVGRKKFCTECGGKL